MTTRSSVERSPNVTLSTRILKPPVEAPDHAVNAEVKFAEEYKAANRGVVLGD